MKKKIFITFSVLILAACFSFVLVACKHNHKWSSDFHSDSDYHWHYCTKKSCNQVTDVEKHTFKKGSDNTYHWQACSVCGYVKDKFEHNYDENFACIDCGYSHIHTIEYEDENHWYTCIDCNINKDKVPHTFKDGECEVCGFKQGTNGLIYTANSDGQSYTLSGVMRDDDESVNNIVIAEYYQGKPVTVIGRGALSARLSLYSVYIPKTIVKIEESAFSDCQSLSEITIPKSVTSIESNVFSNCYGITIKAEASKKPAGWNTSDWEINQFSKFPIVWDCKNNKVADDGYIYVTTLLEDKKPIKYGLKNGEAMVAKQPRRIVYNPIDGSVNNAFDINRVSAVVEYEGNKYNVTSIADYAFSGFDNINTFEVPVECRQIGAYAFENCTQLTAIKWRLNTKIEVIGTAAFIGCIRLDSAMYINDTVSSEFLLPNTIKSLEAGAFSGCVSIRKITLNENIDYVKEGVFTGCSKLIIRCEAQSKPQSWDSEWNNTNRPVIWNCMSGSNTTDDGKIIYEQNNGIAVYILDPANKTAKLTYQDLFDPSVAQIASRVSYDNTEYTVTAIGENAFANQPDITTIQLTSNIKTIEKGAFYGCSNLTKIKFTGSESDWKSIDFGMDWDKNTGDYKIEYVF